MKKIVFPLLAIILIGMACNPKRDNMLIHQKTELGGCNDGVKVPWVENDEAIHVKAALEDDKEDKVIITVSKGTVHVFVGLNYTCKVLPFETKVETIDDVVYLYIIDSGGGYQRCYCYFTFDFIFKCENTTTLNHSYQVLLTNTWDDEQTILSEGVISR